jgi:hypothetical protein
MSATTPETAMESASSAETRIPTGVQLTPFNETFLNDPYHVLKQLRDAEPIHRDNVREGPRQSASADWRSSPSIRHLERGDSHATEIA